MSAQGKNGQIKRDENLMIASKILDRNSSTPNLISLELKDNNKISSSHLEHKDHIFNPTSNITPYILLIALSIHGSIEGIALGVMNSLKDCSILFTAILLHKWAESFALGQHEYHYGEGYKVEPDLEFKRYTAVCTAELTDRTQTCIPFLSV